MKKCFKLTIYKKIFIVIFSLMLGMEVFHAYKDYQYKIDISIQSLETHIMDKRWGLYDLRDQLGELKGLNDPRLIEMFQENKFGLHQLNFVIVDKDFKEISNGDYFGNDINRNIRLEDNNHSSFYILFQSINNASFDEIFNQIKKQAINSKRQLNVEINADFTSNTEIDNYHVFWDDIKYLKIGEHVFIDKDKSQVQTLNFESIVNTLYNLSYYSAKNQYVEFNLKEIRNEVLNLLSQEHVQPGEHKSYILGEDICYAACMDLGSDIYGVLYGIHWNGVKAARWETFDNKKIVYYINIVLFAFAVSGFLSYMITKRVKKMNNATKLITDNHFDIKLKEKPTDELGELSANINRMSQNLKVTIEQLNHEIEHVKELESLRKDFINQFTHEMKTPLGIINGYSELLNEAEDDKEKEKYLDIINRETARINQLIQSMLSLSRLEAGKVELKREEIDLEDVVIDIIDEYEVLLMKKNIQVEVNPLECKINADRKLIETVVRNFLSNAIKHTYETGKIVITMDMGVRVYNEGKVIEEERLDSIWYTFVTHDKNGSGLGLAICRSILEQHGFNYGVNNRNNGVEFYFGC